MKEITLQQFTELKKQRRNKIGVADKLDAFLKSHIASFQKGKAYEIEVKDFLGNDVVDFHYYTARKMLEANYSGKLEWDFSLGAHARTSAVRITVK